MARPTPAQASSTVAALARRVVLVALFLAGLGISTFGIGEVAAARASLDSDGTFVLSDSLPATEAGSPAFMAENERGAPLAQLIGGDDERAAAAPASPAAGPDRLLAAGQSAFLLLEPQALGFSSRAPPGSA
jgi:hypothetical protein